MYNKEQIEKAVKAKKYVWFEDSTNKGFDVNLVGIRNLKSGKKVTNLFDDWMTLSFKEDGVWKFYQWEITTDPGTKAVKEFHNPNGVARVVPNQYRGLWQVGLHQGKYEALRQKGNIEVYRDKNKDMTFDETAIQKGDNFGINCHRSNPKTQSEFVENWSEGCQVFKKIKDFKEFMVIMNKAKNIHGNSFTYTLLTTNDIV